mmetsp:Transcript_14401/g.42883  ORF Transcript_14401/g.42883 Transcript_14401/m.42883 type:complete len:260 (+) Transcript_14401:1530-2309(+)
MDGLKAGAPSAAVSSAQLSLFLGEPPAAGGSVGGSPAAGGLLAWPPAQLFPALDMLRLVVLAPSAASPLGGHTPPLVSRLAALLAAPAEPPSKAQAAVALMVQRCFANLTYSPPTRKLVAPLVSEMLDTLATPIEAGSSGLRLAACTVLLNVSSLLREATLAGETALKADALQLQALSLCAHALSVVAMSAPSEEEALYRLLVGLESLLSLGATSLALALDLDLPAALTALTLPDGAAPKVKDARGRLLTLLATPLSRA